jgi:hypothetical protein
MRGREAKDAKMSSRVAEPLQNSRIERNRIKLNELEREWATLGPIRTVIFEVKLCDERFSESFGEMLEREGFEVFFQLNASGNDRVVQAVRKMEPNAEDVSRWESWFEEQAVLLRERDENGCAPHFNGWRYPSRVCPTFSTDETVWSQSSENDRAKLLFGETLAVDPVSDSRYVGFPWGNFTPVPTFRLVPSEFLRKARHRRPVSPAPTASKFAQWIYSLYSNDLGSDEDRARGEAAEGHILEARRKAYLSAGSKWLEGNRPYWKLVQNGMATLRSSSPQYSEVGDLVINGEALRAQPDLIYENLRTGEMIIVEIKHSSMSIPNNLWPNIWGQLWCYAQLARVRKAPKVTVVGEVWGDAWTGGQDNLRLVCLRASVRRDPRALPYDRFFRALFDIYRGLD